MVEIVPRDGALSRAGRGAAAGSTIGLLRGKPLATMPAVAVDDEDFMRTQWLAVSVLTFTLAGCTTSPAPAPPAATGAPLALATDIDLQALIDNGQGTVRIPCGRHVLRKGLTIEGRSHLTLVAPAGTEILVDDVNADVLTIRKSQHISIEGGHYQHLKPLPEYVCHGDVIRVHDCSDVTVEGATLNGCGAIGLDARLTERITVEKCAITHNSFNAIYLDHCNDIRIWDCIIEDNANLIQANVVSGLEMSGNEIRRNGGYWRTPAARPGPDAN